MRDGRRFNVIMVFTAPYQVETGQVFISKYREYNIGEVVVLCSNITEKKLINAAFNDIDVVCDMVYINEKVKGWETDVLWIDANICIMNCLNVVIENCLNSDLSIGTCSPIIYDDYLDTPLEDITKNRIQKIVEGSSLDIYPEIESGNPYCLYIRKDLFEKNIIFVENREMDIVSVISEFCNDAIQLGYRNVLCDNFLVYNTLNESFVYNVINPKLLKKVEINWSIYHVLFNGKKNVLYLLQSDFREDAEDHIGGTQLHVKDLVMNLRKKFNLYVLARDRDYLNLTIYWENKQAGFRFYVGERRDYEQFYSGLFRKIYYNVVNAFGIDIIHVHHVQGMTRELYEIGKECDIPIITSFHDYYSVCPCIKMLSLDNKICIGKQNQVMCSACLEHNCRIDKNTDRYLSNWRCETKRMIEKSEVLIAPSKSVKGNLESFFPIAEKKLRIIAHGVDVPGTSELRGCAVKKDKTFRIAFLGNLGPEKGSESAYQLITKGPKDIQWHIIGNIGEYRLLMLERKNLVKHGAYKKENLYEIICENHIDLICLLSICPETYCYTLSEALLCKVPVLVRDAGALGERVKKMNCGWVVPLESDYNYILKLINKIRTDSNEYQKIKSKVERLQIESTADMAEKYELLYNQFGRKECVTLRYDRSFLFAAYQQGGDNKFDRAEIENLNLYEELEELRKEIHGIKNSGAYLLGVKIMPRIKIPFKKQIKKYVFRKQ